MMATMIPRPTTTSAAATTIGCVSLAMAASFVIARYDFRGRNAMFSLFAAGLMFPLTVAITPLYILVRSLGLTNNLWGIILPQIAFALPTTVIILVPFLRAIPNEIEEAAALDGMSRLGFFFRMVVPLSLPGVVTVGILAFVGSWNNYLLPLYVLNSQANFTLPLGVQVFAQRLLRDQRFEPGDYLVVASGGELRVDRRLVLHRRPLAAVRPASTVRHGSVPGNSAVWDHGDHATRPRRTPAGRTRERAHPPDPAAMAVCASWTRIHRWARLTG